MTLSAPIHHLKRKAKLLSRDGNIPLHAALDRIAAEEGYAGWSHLTAKAGGISDAAKLFQRLVPGDMLLVGARPGQGKTRFSLELAVEAMKQGRPAFFFTLEYTPRDMDALFVKIGATPPALFTLDSTDGIHAAAIIARMKDAPRGTLAVIDYLQLLDQKRDTLPLAEQVAQLKAFAAISGVIFAFISQIDRAYDAAAKEFPGLDDIRLPNPLDLALFSKTCFINNGAVKFG